jgi:O-antigen ligase
MASTGHPLTLGYLLAVALGFWLYLQQGVQVRVARLGVTVVLLFGLVADYSRGPWVGAILIYFAFAGLGPRAASKIFKAVAAIALLGLAVAASPLGEKVARVVPYFGGTVDLGNVIYRQRLFARSWDIILAHPVLGDQRALLKMEDLRQGEGIIDMINGFMTLLLNNGFVGLSLFVLLVVNSAVKAFRLSAMTASRDPDLSRLGACLIACTLGIMLMTWVGGLIDLMTFILVGLMAAYVDFGRRLPAGVRRVGGDANSYKAGAA